MIIPSYVPIGYCKGWCSDTSEWVYGWHWTKTPYECIAVNKTIHHYIRVQNNLDWGLTSQEDYEVKAESVGYYTGLKDKEGVPIFLGNIVEIIVQDKLMNDNFKLVGVVCYEAINCQYIVKTEKNMFNMSDIVDIKVIGDKYNPEEKVHTVNLQFRKEKIDYEDILNGIKDYYNFFGVYPKEIALTEQQCNSIMYDKDIGDLIKSLNIKVKNKD